MATEQADSSATKQEESMDGLGIGLGIAVVGVLLLLIPLLGPMSSGGFTALLAISAIVTGFGVGFCLTELEKLHDRPELGDIAPATALVAIGFALVIVRVRGEYSTIVTWLLVSGVVVFGSMGVIMLFSGISKALSRPKALQALGSVSQPQSSSSDSRPQTFSSISLAKSPSDNISEPKASSSVPPGEVLARRREPLTPKHVFYLGVTMLCALVSAATTLFEAYSSVSGGRS